LSGRQYLDLQLLKLINTNINNPKKHPMKKIYTFIAALAVVLGANAQGKVVSGSVNMSKEGLPAFAADRTVTDTLVGASWTNGSAAGPTLYSSGNGGYVNGNNGYADKAKVQAFVNSIGSIGIDGALIWFGAKEHDGTATTSKVTVKEYSLNGPGTASSGAVTNAPNTVNASVDVTFAAIDTGLTLAAGGNTIMFPTQILTSTDFGIGVDFSTLGAGDTVGLVSSTDGDALVTDMTWEKWSDNTWYTYLASSGWGLDIDLFIWALVDNNPSGIEEGYLNGANLFVNEPNPAVNSTTVTYALENNTDNVSLMIFDVAGKLVRTYNEGNMAAGKHSINVSTSDLNAGVYYYALTAGKGRIAKKMIVTK
jgi:hypothetical protein